MPDVLKGKVSFVNRDPYDGVYGPSVSIKAVFDVDLPKAKQTQYGWEKMFFATVSNEDKREHLMSFNQGDDIEVLVDGSKVTIITDPRTTGGGGTPVSSSSSGHDKPTVPNKEKKKKDKDVVLFKDLVRMEKLKFAQALEVMREDDFQEEIGMSDEELFTTIRGIMSALQRIIVGKDVVYSEEDLPQKSEEEQKYDLVLTSAYVEGDEDRADTIIDYLQGNLDAAVEFVSNMGAGMEKTEAINVVVKKYNIDLVPV